ncbi:hypothetical protein CNMCM6106_008736 [Aspergillus hiratsukae]|uniref:Uncharacterized protein n=1 Tax=Aspergillus hiratsukae TaxID=1194566 RepID=A0A8H6PVE9_9EURO|nr:hypothetical protein CNMCM6106_008736 [Aspergillus hiratsukae]
MLLLNYWQGTYSLQLRPILSFIFRVWFSFHLTLTPRVNSFGLIPFFCFSWRDSIRPLADITNRLGVYGVPPENIANLVLIHQDITRLRRPDGPDFLIPPPPQSIDREVHCIPTGHLPWALARFGLTKSTYDGVEYRALPDLPGLFMSILGRAPTTASRRNFYLLLTAVYGQWCAKLIPQGRRGLPCVFQCGWTKAGEFHLGAFRGVFAVCG